MIEIVNTYKIHINIIIILILINYSNSNKKIQFIQLF